MKKKQFKKNMREEARSSSLEARTFLRAKKSLGQHFLSSPSYLRTIADAAHIAPGDLVLEIGPGEGTLTRELLSRGARVIAVEKDHRLIPVLNEKFAQEILRGELRIIEADILSLSITDIFHMDSASVPHQFRVVGNIPYYITGALFKKFLSHEPRPSLLIFLIQKEVAERIAKAKKESLLSLSIKAYGEPRYIKTVPRGAFRPAPNVDSAILGVYGISDKNFRDTQAKTPQGGTRKTPPDTVASRKQRFFELIRAGFAQKRKLLARNIEPLLGSSTLELLQKAGIEPKARAEDVPLQQWLALSRF